MKSIRSLVAVAVMSLVALGSWSLAEETAPKVDWAKIKCVVSGKAVNVDAKGDYKGGHVYFCCPGCPGAFSKDVNKFAAKANHQLVATAQAKQEKCPMSGEALDDTTKITVSDVEVAFCCKNCKAAAEGKSGDEQLELVFGDKAFEKGFKMAEKAAK